MVMWCRASALATFLSALPSLHLSSDRFNQNSCLQAVMQSPVMCLGDGQMFEGHIIVELWHSA